MNFGLKTQQNSKPLSALEIAYGGESLAPGD